MDYSKMLKVENYDSKTTIDIFEKFFEVDESDNYLYDFIVIEDGFSIYINQRHIWVHPIISARKFKGKIIDEEGITATQFKKKICCFEFKYPVYDFGGILQAAFENAESNIELFEKENFDFCLEIEKKILFKAQTEWLRKKYRVGEVFDFYITHLRFTSKPMGKLVRGRYFPH